MTEWRAVFGWELLYDVSSAGEIRSVRSSRFLRKMVNSSGYLVVRLSAPRRRAMARVHRILAETFIPNPGRLPEVNHIDGCRTNNALDNLEWVTPSGNRKNAWDRGTRNIKPRRGELNHHNKFSAELVAAVRAQHATGTKRWDLAEAFGLPVKTIKHFLERRRWAHLPEPPR